MTIRLPVIFVGLLLVGCARAPRDLEAARSPFDGEYLAYDATGAAVQRTIWNRDKLVAAWERNDSASRSWTRVAQDGNGVIKVYYRGRHAGFNWFENGEFVRGAG